MKLSIIIPVYNESKTICEVVRRVEAVDADKEIIIVDDGSTDGSRDLLKKYEGRERFKVVYQSKNMGKGRSLRTGFEKAEGEIIIIQDADLEYNPKDYPILLQPILDGHADVVYGSRFIGGESHRVLYFWHSVANRFLTLFSNMMTDINLTDMETCYKVFRREVLDQISLEEPRFGFDPEITAKISHQNPAPRIYEVGIKYNGRTYDEGKKIGWRDGIRVIISIIRYNLFR